MTKPEEWTFTDWAWLIGHAIREGVIAYEGWVEKDPKIATAEAIAHGANFIMHCIEDEILEDPDSWRHRLRAKLGPK